MATINAVFENGVFRPTETVDLPDRCPVQLHVHPFVPETPKNAEEIAKARLAVFEILGRRFHDEDAPTDLAARHNEHQP